MDESHYVSMRVDFTLSRTLRGDVTGIAKIGYALKVAGCLKFPTILTTPFLSGRGASGLENRSVCKPIVGSNSTLFGHEFEG
jgi:hypothetical protein